jgi:hypothetical protein
MLSHTPRRQPSHRAIGFPSNSSRGVATQVDAMSAPRPTAIAIQSHHQIKLPGDTHSSTPGSWNISGYFLP